MISLRLIRVHEFVACMVGLSFGDIFNEQNIMHLPLEHWNITYI